MMTMSEIREAIRVLSPEELADRANANITARLKREAEEQKLDANPFEHPPVTPIPSFEDTLHDDLRIAVVRAKFILGFKHQRGDARCRRYIGGHKTEAITVGWLINHTDRKQGDIALTEVIAVLQAMGFDPSLEQHGVDVRGVGM